MIELPRRSVTRFFIPLIDVLILLFCIFLLLPLVQLPPSIEGDQSSAAEAEREFPSSRRPRGRSQAETQKLLQEDIARLRREVQLLRQDKVEKLQERLAVRVLEIDADTGKLYFQEPDGRLAISSQADARALIERQRAAAAGRELYFLFLYPRRLTGFPEQKQVRQYERWFEDVAHGFDNPRGSG